MPDTLAPADARKAADLSQAQAAREIGVHRNTLSRYEIGALPLPARVVEAMSVAYGLGTHEVRRLLAWCGR